MRRDEASSRSRLLLVLAYLSLLLAVLWSVRSPPAPNADRYDYVGRAYQATRGHGFSPLVVYPLRLALPDAGRWPPSNLSRPPLWPALLVPGLQVGLDDRAGVVLAALCAAAVMGLVAYVGDRTFGPGAGGMAALAFVASFTTVRGIWGGGPELALALLTFLLWTWSPALHGNAGYLACGSLYGLLPLLHPTGWCLGILAFAARSHRYSDRGRVLVVVAAVLVGAPWYLRWWAMTGAPLGFLQGQAELARSVLDPGGLGPYRTLEPVSGSEVLQHDLVAVVKAGILRAKHHVVHLDAWLSWPLVALTLLGFRRDPYLALRDVMVVAVGFLALGFWSAESRLLLPLLPVLCVWTGAGFVTLCDLGRRAPWILAAAALAAVPWVLPAGLALRPGEELRALSPDLLSPPVSVVEQVGAAGAPEVPMITDSGVLAWRARRSAVLLPDSPRTLSRLRRRPVLHGSDVLVLARGRESRWIATHKTAWDSLMARSTFLRDAPTYLMLQLPEEPEP